MKRTTIIALLALFLTLALAACGGGGDGGSSASSGGATAGNAANGEKLYHSTTIGSASAPGCVTCHSTDPGVVLVGPSHAGIGTRAASAVPGTTAEEYLRRSIVDPNADITEGFTAGVMYQNYGKELSEQDISDLVAYLMTLK